MRQGSPGITGGPIRGQEISEHQSKVGGKSRTALAQSTRESRPYYRTALAQVQLHHNLQTGVTSALPVERKRPA